MVNTEGIIAELDSWKGKITYSMNGSRNGSDGTADCSGGMTQCLADNGALAPAYLYSTETIHSYLKANGFVCVHEGTGEFTAKRGQIIVFGKQGDSAGANGHIGIIDKGDPDATLLSVCYWTGGLPGTAVQSVSFDSMWEADNCPYFYVYELQGEQEETVPEANEPAAVSDTSAIKAFKDAGGYVNFNNTQFRLDAVGKYVGIWQGISIELAGGNDWSWLENGIPLALVHLTDNDNQNNATVGNHFAFDQTEWPIKQYDNATNGIGVDFGVYGIVWINADVALKA